MSTGDSEGPAWGRFWLSLDNESESMVSGEGGSHRAHTPGHRSAISPDTSRPFVERVDSVQPHESASHHGDESPTDEAEIPSSTFEDSPFPFKFKAPSGRVHRLQVAPSAGMTELIGNVTAKLGSEIDAVGGEAFVENGQLGKSGYALSYLDNEGDTVSITTDQDLLDAISLARKTHRDKVDLFVHDPEKPPMTATIDPHPALAKPLTPPQSDTKSLRGFLNDDDVETPVKKSKAAPVSQSKQQPQEQIVSGVPNDLLLPGAIVTLAAVIVGVFAFSRSSK